MVTEPPAEETQAPLLLLLCKTRRTEQKQLLFRAVLGGDVQAHQVRLAVASALGSREVLPAGRADFLKPAVTWSSPPHGQGRWAAGKKGQTDVHTSHTPSQTARERSGLRRPFPSSVALPAELNSEAFLVFDYFRPGLHL